MRDLWGRGAQVLAGDWEEHALLLWHYLVWLQGKGQLEARWAFYLVLGRAIPEGSARYVLQLDPSAGEAVVWNACTGEAMDAADPRLPLADVGCLVGPDNIWANVQREGRPADLSRLQVTCSPRVAGGCLSERFLHARICCACPVPCLSTLKPCPAPPPTLDSCLATARGFFSPSDL